jgi:HEAT repeat protein
MKLFHYLVVGCCFALLGSEVFAEEPKAPTAAESIAVLQDAGASAFDKAKACQRLAIVGGNDAIAALVAQLADEQLNVYARSALEAIDDPAVDQALRDAAKELSGRQLAGVLLSIGNRRDAKALPLLKEQLGSEDAAIASAAAAALCEIGTAEAGAVLKEALAKRSDAEWLDEAALECAERLGASDKKAATDLYAGLIDSGSPKHIKLAAMLGKFRLQDDGKTEWLVEQLQHEDRDYFNLGLAAAREDPGAEATKALVKLLPSLVPERRALLLRALGDRSDALPVATVLAEAKSDSPDVQVAAVAVLAKSKEAAAAAELVNLALGDGEAAKIAAERLSGLESKAVDAAISKRLGQSGQNQPTVIALVGKRRMASLKPQLIELLASDDPATRQVVLVALGQVAELDDLDLLLDRSFSGAPEAEKNAAQEAVRSAAMRMSDREACASRLADRLSGSSPEEQAFLLTRLREVGGNNALKTVVALSVSDEPELKDAATRELGAWPTADASEALLKLAKEDSDSKYRVRALRGYLRIARQLQLADEERIRYFKAAMELAERDQEKQLALDVLARVPTVQSLELATSHLSDAAVRDAAADAALAVANKLVTSEPAKVKAAMEKVQAAGVSDKTAERAREISQKAGA